jgi:mRNA-degrading endonuclease RelE of RelBE toxin-antitoxin system
MREYDISLNLKRILKKLYKKDKVIYENIWEKIEEILTCEDVNHYKNLRKPLQRYKRIQVRSFVLIFEYIQNREVIIFEDFDHHDNIYKIK